MKVSFVGIGLMNGSLSLDLQRLYPDAVMQGISRKEATLSCALDLGLIHETGDLDQLQDADWVFVSIPVAAIAALLPRILDAIGEQTLVVDFGSTKAAICEAVKLHPKRAQFLAAHPIAGTEHSGPDAAVPELYKGKTIMLCDTAHTRQCGIAEAGIRRHENRPWPDGRAETGRWQTAARCQPLRRVHRRCQRDLLRPVHDVAGSREDPAGQGH